MRKLLSIIVMILNTITINGQNKCSIISPSQSKWEIVNDNVMGGVSKGNVEIQNDNEKIAQSNLRTWHFIWSKFYYFNKHYGKFLSLIYFFPIIIRILFRMFLYICFFYKKKLIVII